jgi:microcystin-dependent protein
MQLIQHTTASPTKPDYVSTGQVGWFREGEAGGDSPTYVTADWANLMQGEIVSVIDAAAIELDSEDDTQLLQAITALIDARLAALALFPIGSIMMRAVNNAPAGWLMCDGAALGRVPYAALFAAIGTTFGAGDGLETFNLPDLRNVFIRAHDARTGRLFGSAQADGVKLPALSATVSQSGAYTGVLTTTTATLTHGTVTVATAGAVGGQALTLQISPHYHAFTTDLGGAHTHTSHYDKKPNVPGTGGEEVMKSPGSNWPFSFSAPAHVHDGYTDAVTATGQVWVPAIPSHAHTASVPAHDPHSHQVSLTLPNHAHAVAVTGDDDDETRPANITLAFMIRAV